MNTNNLETNPLLSGKTATVHKANAEGTIQIDTLTGWVVTNQEERPEWADGLVTAMLAERHGHYTAALGPHYADAHKSPETFAFEDLSWVGVNTEDGDEYVLDADAEFRMDVKAEVLGIDREAGTVAGELASTEIANDRVRSEAEAQALYEAQTERFERTGTSE